MTPSHALAVHGAAAGVPAGDVLDEPARELVTALERRARAPRAALLRSRGELARRVAAGTELAPPERTRWVREDATWQVAPPPADLALRRVELVTPATADQATAAASSGADVWVADLEDSLVPTWERLLAAHRVLREAVTAAGDGRPALVVRPRGLHLTEDHLEVDGEPVGAAVADVGLFLAGQAGRLLAHGRTPALYLPKLEGHEEARWWDDLLAHAEALLGLARGTVRVSVLVETVQAVHELDEVLHALRDRVTALAAGRWDYVFSHLRTYAARADHVLPDLDSVTMHTGFLRTYTNLIVRTCRRRGAQALGGPVTEVPGGPFDEATLRARARVRRDKAHEAREGFQGTWVLHPAQVPTAREAFDRACSDPAGRAPAPGALRGSVTADPPVLRGTGSVPGTPTLTGLRGNVRAVLTYLTGWLDGHGRCVIGGHLHDFGTVELARTQLWQWVQHQVPLAEGPAVTERLLARVVTEETALLRRRLGDTPRLAAAVRLLTEALTADVPPAFLSTRTYQALLEGTGRPVRTAAA